MVKIIPKRRSGATSSVFPAVACMGLLVLIGVIGWRKQTVNTGEMVGTLTKLAESGALSAASSSLGNSGGVSGSSSSITGLALKQCRAKVRDQCKAATTKPELLAVSEANKACFEMPKIAAVPQQPRGEGAVRRCKHVVMDFGANIGDTSGHVVDTGAVDCGTKKQMEEQALLVHFDVQQKAFVNTKRRNPLTRNIAKLIEDDGAEVGAEDYCYYGVEGNPVFTERLRGIEDYVMAIQPKPIQHMHFFTESVGAGADGPTKLYLDTVNVAENYWGSSILAGHQDVRKSAAQNKESGGTGEKKAVDVMGYTIGKLMRDTLQAFAPDATPEQKKGNHLILKVDIEGGEYPLLSQASTEDNTLCEFVAMGNKADLFIEFHSIRVTGSHPLAGKAQEFKKKLSDCGVVFRHLQAWWH